MRQFVSDLPKAEDLPFDALMSFTYKYEPLYKIKILENSLINKTKCILIYIQLRKIF